VPERMEERKKSWGLVSFTSCMERKRRRKGSMVLVKRAAERIGGRGDREKKEEEIRIQDERDLKSWPSWWLYSTQKKELGGGGIPIWGRALGMGRRSKGSKAGRAYLVNYEKPGLAVALNSCVYCNARRGKIEEGENHYGSESRESELSSCLTELLALVGALLTLAREKLLSSGMGLVNAGRKSQYRGRQKFDLPW